MNDLIRRMKSEAAASKRCYQVDSDESTDDADEREKSNDSLKAGNFDDSESELGGKCRICTGPQGAVVADRL